MTAAQNDPDGSDCAASSFDYEDFFSVLMHYYPAMNQEEILKHGRKFLLAMYKKYVDRACENLGVPSSNKDGEDELQDNDYPSEFVKFSQAEREREIEQSGESDSDFLKKFVNIGNF